MRPKLLDVDSRSSKPNTQSNSNARRQSSSFQLRRPSSIGPNVRVRSNSFYGASSPAPEQPSLNPIKRARSITPICSSVSRQSSPKHLPSASPTRGKTFEDMKSSSGAFIMKMRNRKKGCQKVKSLLKAHYNACDVFEEAINLEDKTVLVHLLEQLVYKSVNLKLAATILPELRGLLSHRNRHFADVALDILDTMVIQLIDQIRNGLSRKSRGAEERYLLCIRCRKALTELYITSPFANRNLSDEQRLHFMSTIDKFIDIIEAN